MPTERQILKGHDQRIDAIVAAFTDDLGPIIDKAQTEALKQLQRKLTLAKDGTIERNAENQRVLRRLDVIFSAAMKKAGYHALVESYTQQFADHLPTFNDVLNQLTAQAKSELPAVQFTTQDTSYFASQALGAQSQIMSVVDAAAAVAKQKALFGVGGLTFADLATLLREQFEVTKARAVTLADTSVNVFYRSISARQFEIIEEDLPNRAIKYRYIGPDDQKTRVFCEQLLQVAKPYTRAQIDEMNNGQLADVFTTAGGWNCRHVWIIDTAELMKKAA